MIRPGTLDFPPLHVSFDRELGDYYQDFSGAIALVEGGYHGTRDERGIPLVRRREAPPGPNPITTAQYALANMIAFRRGDEERGLLARRLLEALVSDQATEGPARGCWPMLHDDPKYRWLRDPWLSSLASGNALSALLRGWQVFDDKRYRAAADEAYAGLHASREGPPLLYECGDELWYEEYPADVPLHVLNGHVYTLLGVLDYARATGDETAEERWRRAARTVLVNLDGFDLGYWSAYDLRSREPATRHYHKNIHVPQLRILARLTGEGRFAAMADRWERQVASRLSWMHWEVAIRVHARRKRL
jgi:heparosan-N-sulfate-glucuronate 5-epimerase